MSSDVAISVIGLAKCYQLYAEPVDRLRQMVWRNRRFYREFWALRDLDLEVKRGEVLGIVGRNGAGKSTLLQLICGTLNPTSGKIVVNGRVAALLELGSGFNPEFSGRENVFMSAAVMGLNHHEISAIYDQIVDFSGVRDFIDQPVKTYSSGMYIRLAFSVAINVSPDILIIDEALSVGDGAFARKSFDRIMALKEEGKTIIFCSHSMYQVEVLCSRALWLEQGRVKMLGPASEVTNAYNTALAEKGVDGTAGLSGAIEMAPPGTGRVLKVSASADGLIGTDLPIRSGESNLVVIVEYVLAPDLAAPSVALGFADAAGTTIGSVISNSDGIQLTVDRFGRGQARVSFPNLPLLKGQYSVSVVLACENALHVYDIIERSITLRVTQKGAEQGLITLSHTWQQQ